MAIAAIKKATIKSGHLLLKNCIPDQKTFNIFIKNVDMNTVKLIIFFTFILSLNSLLWACEDINHEKLFIDTNSHQGTVGSCHSYAIIHLIEAKWKQSFNVSVDFSQGDLFRQHLTQMGQENFYKNQAQIILSCSQVKPELQNTVLKSFEGAYFFSDWELMKKNGICKEDSQTSSFRYGAGSKTLEKLQETKCSMLEQYKGALQSCQSSNIDTLRSEAENNFCKVLSSEKFYDQLENQKTKECDKDREWSKFYLNKFQPFAVPNPKSKETLLAYLKCHPLWISVDDFSKAKEGIIEQEPNPYAKHAVVLAGYNCSDKSFLIKNSWGESRLLKIKEDVLLAKIDQAHGLALNQLKADENGSCDEKEKKIQTGDLNEDGKIDDTDVDLFYQFHWLGNRTLYSNSESLIEKKKDMAMDINGDGVIDIKDSKMLIEFVVLHKPEKLPARDFSLSENITRKPQILVLHDGISLNEMIQLFVHPMVEEINSRKLPLSTLKTRLRNVSLSLKYSIIPKRQKQKEVDKILEAMKAKDYTEAEINEINNFLMQK